MDFAPAELAFVAAESIPGMLLVVVTGAVWEAVLPSGSRTTTRAGTFESPRLPLVAAGAAIGCLAVLLLWNVGGDHESPHPLNDAILREATFLPALCAAFGWIAIRRWSMKHVVACWAGAVVLFLAVLVLLPEDPSEGPIDLDARSVAVLGTLAAASAGGAVVALLLLRRRAGARSSGGAADG